MNIIREGITLINIGCFLWNCITLLADKVTTNTVGVIWIFNISIGVLVVERYFPEIKQQWAKILLYTLITVGHILACILLFTEKVTTNMVFDFIANIFSFILSFCYFAWKENQGKNQGGALFV
jgi:hypothetical protein